MDRVRTDQMGPGQRLAITLATREVGKRITNRDNSINIRWTPAHREVEGNEAAGTWAKAASEWTPPSDDSTFLREKSDGGQIPGHQGLDRRTSRSSSVLTTEG